MKNNRGGMPVGAVCGHEDVFEPARPEIPPDARVLAGGGMFTSNPLTAVAGLATLEVIGSDLVYEHTERPGERLRDGLAAIFDEEGVTGDVLGFSSLVNPVFNVTEPINSLTEVKELADTDAADKFHVPLYDHGYYFNRGSMGNVSFATTDRHMDKFLSAARNVVLEMKNDDILR